MVHYESKSAKIELLANSSIVKLTWLGLVPSEEYRDVLTKATELATKLKITNWLTDARFVKVIRVEDQNWAMSEWMPNAVNAGVYKRQAVILPDDIFGQASAKRMISKINGQDVEFNNFNAEATALEWLTSDVTV